MTIKDEVMNTDDAIHERLLDKLRKKIDERRTKESSQKKKEDDKQIKELATKVKKYVDDLSTDRLAEEHRWNRWKSEINRIVSLINEFGMDEQPKYQAKDEPLRKKILKELLDEIIEELN